MNIPEDARLISVAGAISNGDEVGWDELRDHNHDPVTGRMLRELQVVERIAAFHRHSHWSDAPTTKASISAPELTLQSWGHLTLLERIGTGAFGSVYRARDSKLQTDVALKLVALRNDFVGDPVRSLKEARLLARIRHPNVVRIYGADVIDGRVGIWMEFVEGQTLAAMLRARASLGAREAALIGADLCQALAAVHAAGLIHGDVKAGNVMREAGGRTVLMDFGTGKDVSLPPPDEARGLDFAGTPLYLAPEVFRGEPRSKLNDVYALGVLLFHMVTQDYPVAGRTQAEVEEAHARGARRRLRDIRPDLPTMFVEAVERAIAADSRDRFQSVGEFESALMRFLGRTDEPPAPTFRTWWLAAACVALIAALGTVAYWTKYRVHVASLAEAPPPLSITPPPSSPSTYQIDAAVYRRRAGSETRLRVGDRVGPGDELYATLRVSVPTYVYIVNEDDRGDSFLLFPLPGRAIDNPIAAATPVRIPGTRDKDLAWQVTSAGGREHFLIFASSERLQAFEELFAALPQPTIGKPVVTKLPEGALKRLRGVGGLTTATTGQAGAGLAGIFTSPLGNAEETAHGLWVRRLTVENPIRP